ncbi:uncharacterized protein LOC133460178 [Cololabis saira]|uniref:uncharacterized protein LOC133460178 n=1 Tax=Cololabis saira TaxID=129043 RepID=UPI002AD4F11C|nr:uncharacterized protein LOC133460178 [Cololabis saira]
MAGWALAQSMILWQQGLLLLGILNFVESSSTSTLLQRCSYKNSFRLTRSTRTRVQQLLWKYKEQQLGDVEFDDRGWQLSDLPSLSTDFSGWLQLADWDRLHAAFWDMQSYWIMLERKRTQLEREVKGQAATLPQSIKHIQLDLRDLMSQVSSQMRFMRNSWIKPTPPALHLTSQGSPKTVWDSRVEGFIILRDLNLYLTKLARDFLILALKTQP